MIYTVYILYSATLKRYYVGYTSMSMEERLQRHLHNHGGFTSKAKDWTCVWFVQSDSKSEVMQMERKIKKRGAARFISDQ